MENFKYFAFISYNTLDMKWGKRLQHKLENYKMPAMLCLQHGWERKPINPVFFAPTDILPGGLTEELQERLKASHNLIVICSPHSARSEWVGKEIEFFYKLGRAKQIHFFIVAGEPNSGKETECFNPIVKELEIPEILGANINERIYRWPWLNRERAYVQLISKLLNVEYDSIWQRHKRQMLSRKLKMGLACLAVLAAMVGIWTCSQPFDVRVNLHEASCHNGVLDPMDNAIVTMKMENETKTDTAQWPETYITFTNIPHRYLKKNVRVMVRCKDFNEVDTLVTLGENVTVELHRDTRVYGNVNFTIWDWRTERPVPNVNVEIEGVKTTSDEDGHVKLFIPLEKQKKKYRVLSSIHLAADTVYMPCGEYDVLTTK